MKNSLIISGIIAVIAISAAWYYAAQPKMDTSANISGSKANNSTFQISPGAPDEKITGITREQVVGPIIASCTSKLKENPQTASLPPDLVSTWCSCNANEIADHMTNADIAALTQGTRTQTDIIEPKATAAVAVCQDKVKITAAPDSK